MAQVEILDRSEMTDQLKEVMALDPKETVIVTIDMHRGHLDPEVATMPAAEEDCEKVIGNAEPLLHFARSHRIPVVHVKLVFRKIPGLGSEGMINPFWRTLHDIQDEKNRLTLGRKSTVNDHNIMGEPTTELIPSLFEDGDYVIDNKKRLDCFMGTDLKGLLDILDAKNVCLMGINTNTCVLNTAFTAFNHDYRVVVLSDCVASMYGPDLHVLGLQNVMRCLGLVFSNEEFMEKVAEGAEAGKKGS
ncbi:MAG: cysteine hydrolase [bacterium]